MKGPGAYQKSRVEQSVPARVILPTTAEAAQAPPPVQQLSVAEPAPASSPEPVNIAPTEKKVEKVDTKKAEMKSRERHKRYAERKARREVARARQQMEPKVQQEPRILAFGGDEPRQTQNPSFFGN
jgi:hypothetical protein